MLVPFVATALLTTGAAPAFVVTPCVDQVTVRDAPSVTGQRLGAVPRGTPLEVLREAPPQTLTLTVDQNVPAPFRLTAHDAWLEVRFPVDGGQGTGWVFGGLLCRPSLRASSGRFTLLGWSGDGSRLAFVETAPDSGACGFGSPSTLRVVDSDGRELSRVHDDCPAAEFSLARRDAVNKAMVTHSIATSWRPALAGGAGWTASLDGGACGKSRFARCPLVVRDAKGLRADVVLSLAPDAVDVDGGFPRVELVGVLRRDGREDAIVRVASSEAVHRFEVVMLSDGPLSAWRRFLPGVHLTGQPGPDAECGDAALEGDGVDASATARLATLNAELSRRLKAKYRGGAGGGFPDASIWFSHSRPFSMGAPLGGWASDVWHRRQTEGRLYFPAVTSAAAAVVLFVAFLFPGQTLVQLPLLALFGVLVTCFIAPGAAVTQDVVPPGLRAFSYALCVIVQHLAGDIWSPGIVGWLSDQVGLANAVRALPLWGLFASGFFLLAARHYRADLATVEQVELRAERA